MFRTKQKVKWTLAVVLLLGPCAAQAQAPSSRPITLIVAQSVGSAVDVITRLYADAVSKAIGRTIVIENRPAGGGVIALQGLKQAPADGNTLVVVANGPLTIAPWIRKQPYDVNEDFETITILYGFLQFVTVSAESPVTSMKGFMEFAKQKQGGLTYSSLGVGSMTHLLCAWLARDSGTTMQHVAYNNTPQYLLDLATNRVDFTFASYQSTNSLWHDKKIRYLASTTPTRSALTPQVPTMAEEGYPDIRYGVWLALLAPKGTPSAVVGQLNEQFRSVSRNAQVAQRLSGEGIVSMDTSPAEAKAMIASESAITKRLVEEFGIAARQ